jgi:hypothetical protein
VWAACAWRIANFLGILEFAMPRRGAVAQLEADMKVGVVSVGEVSKSFGLGNRKPDGSRLRIDDAELDCVC